MSWVAVLLIGVAMADIAHSIRRAPVVNECAGAAVAVWVGLFAGLTDWPDLLALLAIAVVVVLWGLTVTRAFADGAPMGPWVPLLVLGGSLVLALLCSPWASPAGGLVGDWLDATPVPPLVGLSTDRALLVVGAFLLMLSTGNVLVRLVLSASGTTNPAFFDTPEDPGQRLKGGGLLGPMERVLILGLGLAGHLTAASIVIAGKGLLRWPELQSKPEQQWIHRLTEYFLVGSFVSWLVALGALALLVR
jgi:hypothetical protein